MGQNNGVTKAEGSDYWTKDECLFWCNAQDEKTGCELIHPNYWNRGCYLHTAEVSRGNNDGCCDCWICTGITTHISYVNMVISSSQLYNIWGHPTHGNTERR